LSLDFGQERGPHEVHDFDLLIDIKDLVLIGELDLKFLYLYLHVQKVLQHA
jgi:hypothetical protein